MTTAIHEEQEWWPWLASQYGGPSPYGHPWVEIERDEWSGPQIVEPTKMDPMMNCVGLYWRPVTP